MSESVEKIAKFLAKLDAQNFGPKDSVVVSAINNPVGAVKKGIGFLSDQIKTINSPVMPSYKKAEAALNLAEIAQTSAFPMAPSSKGGTLGSITTYHGSPHKFDKFDMSKIGTGEGAQAYGHGLYFAENPDVATQYRDALSSGELRLKGGGEYNPKDPYHFAAAELLSYGGDKKKAINDISASIKQLGQINADWRNDAISQKKQLIELINNGKLPELEEISHGNLYKTSLEWPDAAREAADPLGPQHFLDWESPTDEGTFARNSLKGKLLSNGKDIADFDYKKGRDLYSTLSMMLGNEQKAADFMKKQGVPGIRYLDGGSRGTGEGSYNYVVFDDKIPKIVERNGVAFPIYSGNK